MDIQEGRGGLENALENTPLLSDTRRQRLYSTSRNGSSPIVSELETSTQTEILSRGPLEHRRASTPNMRERADSMRYQYYLHLDPGPDSTMLRPPHTCPEEMLIIALQSKLPQLGQQSSLVTILSIWNTMMGTSILSMPWAIEQAGLAMGIFCIITFSSITLYTAYLVLCSIEYLQDRGVEVHEFTDVCRYYFNRWGSSVSNFFSLLTLLGAAIVYLVLMSNFLFNIGTFIHEKAFDVNGMSAYTHANYSDVVCLHPPHPPPGTSGLLTSSTSSWSSLAWNQTLTVPVYIAIFMMLFLNFKSPTFFTRLNSLGAISALFIMVFVVIKGIQWGFHVDFTNRHAASYIPQFQPTFASLTGILSLAYFIHNCIISIMRNQKHPKNNGRDLAIAWFLVTGSYVLVGVVFYLSYPLAKGCIEDNLLNNFHHSDPLTVVARVSLLTQMMTVYPLLAFIFRSQLLKLITGEEYPGVMKVFLVNVFMLLICVFFAVVLPQIGTIIRFSGALCGFVYVFALPTAVYMRQQWLEGNRKWWFYMGHSLIIFMGFANLAAQFGVSFMRH